MKAKCGSQGCRSGGRNASDQVLMTARQLFAKYSPETDNASQLLKQMVEDAHTVIKLTAVSAEQEPHSTVAAFVMNPRGVQELVTCFATETDVLPSLPPALNASDFDPLPVASIDQVRTDFARAAGGALAQDSFEIRAK